MRCAATPGSDTLSGCASSEGRITFDSEAQPTSCHIDVDAREDEVEVEAPSKIQLGREERLELPEPDTSDCSALLGTVTSCAVAI